MQICVRPISGSLQIPTSDRNTAQLITPTSTINGITCDNLTAATACNTAANANLRAPYLGFSTNSNLRSEHGTVDHANQHHQRDYLRQFNGSDGMQHRRECKFACALSRVLYKFQPQIGTRHS